MTMRLSCTDTEIGGFKDFRGYELELLGSRDVISHVTIELGVSTFLLVVNDDQHLSCTYTEIRDFKDFGVTSLTLWGHVTSSGT